MGAFRYGSLATDRGEGPARLRDAMRDVSKRGLRLRSARSNLGSRWEIAVFTAPQEHIILGGVWATVLRHTISYPTSGLHEAQRGLMGTRKSLGELGIGIIVPFELW